MKLFLNFKPIKNKFPIFFIQLYSNLNNNNYLNSFKLQNFKNKTIYTDVLLNNINIVNLQNNFKIIKKSNLSQIIFKNINTQLKQIYSIFLFNLKWILLSLLISCVYFFISLFYLQLDFTKQIAIWFIILTFTYLLMSTFNNLINKYKYGKFTSAIQRFWKRTGMIFWLLEGFLFSLFFYYFLNSSQEPLYMFDYSNLNQELLINLKNTFKNMISLSIGIYFSFIIILNNNYLTYYQNILMLSFITIIIFYTLYIETYQFVYIILKFSEKEWIFDEIEKIWILEFEQNIFRVKQQYFILCLIAKFWHFIFIFISWFFFIIKCFEINKINYTLMGFNVQNLIILYILNLLCLIQWVKYISKKFLEITYYWFHIQYDEKVFINFIFEFLTIITNLFNVNFTLVIFNDLNLISTNLFYTNENNIWKYINWI